jgi:hypothetical protein
MQYLEEKYRGLTAWERDAWLEVLPHLRNGELRPLLERWHVNDRPSPYAVLDYLRTQREPVVLEPPPPRQRTITPTIQEIIDKAKADLGR